MKLNGEEQSAVYICGLLGASTSVKTKMDVLEKSFQEVITSLKEIPPFWKVKIDK